MLLTGAQPHPSKCREHVWRLFKFDHFSGVACCRSSPPLPSHPSVFFPLLVFLPTHPRPQNRSSALQDFPVAAHGQNISPKAVAKSVRKRSNSGPAQVSLVPFLNRFSTDLQPICNRFSTGFQPRSPTTTDLQPIFNRAPNQQPFLNRFSTVFQPIFNRFSTVCATDFQPCSEAGGPKWPQRVGDTRVLHKETGGKDGLAEGRDGSEQQAEERQTPQSPPPTLLQLVGKGRGPGVQFGPEQQGKFMFHQCPLLETHRVRKTICLERWSGPTKELSMGQQFQTPLTNKHHQN